MPTISPRLASKLASFNAQIISSSTDGGPVFGNQYPVDTLERGTDFLTEPVLLTQILDTDGDVRHGFSRWDTDSQDEHRFFFLVFGTQIYRMDTDSFLLDLGHRY